MLPNDVYETCVALTSKSSKNSVRDKNDSPIFLAHMDATFTHKILTNQIQQCMKKITHLQIWGLSLGVAK